MLTVGAMWLTWVLSRKVRVAPCRPKGELETSSRKASMGCMTEQVYRTLTSALPLGGGGQHIIPVTVTTAHQ